MRKRFILPLLVLLLTTLSTHAYTFQSGDLYYNIRSKNTVEVTYQEYGSTANYQGLTTAAIPESVTYGGTTYSVTSIGEKAFKYCSSLTSITIPNSVTSIGESAFSGCSTLTSITIPNSVTSIGSSAFENCSSLTSITIPNSVTSIGDYTFRSCSALTSITIPNSVTSIGQEAFGRCSSLTSITIPNSVTSIGEEAFRYCSALTSITIPNSVTSIGRYAFEGCSSLTSITIPESVTSIGFAAFGNCSSLTSLTIGNSVTSIGDYAFGGRSSLTQITCLAPTPPTCGDDCFYNVPRTIPLYVPAESVEAYKAAETWKEFNVHALSTDATLSSLTYDGMMVPFFDADTLHYTVELPSETVAIPVVDAVANDPNAQVVITQAVALPGEATVEVIATDGTTRQTYTIYFCKESNQAGIPDSPDATETVSDKGAEKILRNGQVVIIRNGETYDLMGQRL